MSTDESQTIRSFVRAAAKRHPHLQYAKIDDTLWGLYIWTLNKGYTQCDGHIVKTLVSCIGRQPGNPVWMCNPDLQVNENGAEIPMEEQAFYWLVICTHCLHHSISSYTYVT